MASKDDRYNAVNKPIVKYQFDSLTWDTGDGHAAQTATIYDMNLLVERVDVLISSVTANPTVNVSFADENSVAVIDPTSFTTLADGTNHILLATNSTQDFSAVAINNALTITVDPSADAGGSSQTLTVDVILYGI